MLSYNRLGTTQTSSCRFILLLLGLFAGPVAAHPLAPALLELREGADAKVHVRFKTSLYPRSRAAAELLLPKLPPSCERVGPSRIAVEGGGRVERFQLRCAGGVVGQEVGVGGLRENAIDALLRVELRGGRTFQHVLRAGRETVAIPARPDRLEVFVSYLDMGTRHIFSGLDHLLFVFGLVLLVAGGAGYVSRLLLTLSAFTVGHCVTLGGAAVGWLRLPGPPVEFLIALSVLALAVELARPERDMRSTRLPWLLAGGFGLLHGLGFAAALLEAGLPEGEILLALLSFNLGIELGQVLFVLAVLILLGSFRAARIPQRVPTWSARVPVYAMGSLSAMWCIERMAAMFR
jgi:hydrogenase/urease accessory protein HupE